MMPAGREPLSRSSSHSYPNVPAASVPPTPWMRVLRHMRRFAIEAGTVMATVPLLTVQNWPVVDFSGRLNAALGVDAADVLHVVAVRFEEPHHRVFSVEQPALRIVATSVERAVVADLCRPRPARARVRGAGVADRSAAIQAAADAVHGVAVIGLPRRVRRLQDDARRAAVVAHDEDDVTRTNRRAAGGRAAEPIELRDVDARHAQVRAPLRHLRPVAAIGQPCARIRETRRLIDYWQRLRRDGRDRCDLSRALALLVVAKAVDLDSIRSRARNLEADRLCVVDADVGCEPLNGGIAGAGDVPFRLVVADLRVLRLNGIP